MLCYVIIAYISRPNPEGCHVCGEVDHKRKDCPLKTEPRQSTSRIDKIKKRKRRSGVDQSLKDLKSPAKMRKKENKISYQLHY